jgi:hypothetical protein
VFTVFQPHEPLKQNRTTDYRRSSVGDVNESLSARLRLVES